MSDERYVICGDAEPQLPRGLDAHTIRLRLYGPDNAEKVTLRIDDIRRQMYKEVPVRFHDLLDC